MNPWVKDADRAVMANGHSKAVGQSNTDMFHDPPLRVVPRKPTFRRQRLARAEVASYRKGDSKALQPVNQRMGVVVAFFCLSLGIFSLSWICFARPAQVNPAEGTSPDRAQGRQAFDNRCATCHGLDGRGGEHAPGIVNNPAVVTLTDDQLANIIRRGIPGAGMPSFHFLTSQQIEELVRYVRVLRGSTRAVNLKGDPAMGAKLFFGEARCFDCHVMQGKGGFIGSDLSEYGRSHTVAEIRQVILRPNKVLVPRWQLVKIVTRSGQRFSGLVRNEDNFSIALLSKDGIFHLLMKSDIAKITREPRSIMPDDYGKQLNAKQLDDLVSYIILGSAHKRSEGKSAEASSSK